MGGHEVQHKGTWRFLSGLVLSSIKGQNEGCGWLSVGQNGGGWTCMETRAIVVGKTETYEARVWVETACE